MSKKSCYILTHPLAGNYGGMLQAWALRTAVSAFIPNVDIFDYRWGKPSHRTLLQNLRPYTSILLRSLALFLGLRSKHRDLPRWIYYWQGARFRKKIGVKKRNPKGEAAQGCRQWIVGSDQVWRTEYARDMKTLPFFFLDFETEESRHESFSYAASFGTDTWNGTPEETMACKKFLQQFKAVSVREFSGVEMCRDIFGVEAVQMPDPTFLVQLEDYQKLIESEKTYQRQGPYIAAYVLDEEKKSLQALQAVSEHIGLSVQHLMPHTHAQHRRDRFSVSVSQWLRYIKEAEFVVTDSFHGCVFSIIFNKPFVCLGNADRGSARFDTLFQIFHLESRLATSQERAVAIAQEPIDWSAVNTIRDSERARGLAFLRENLSSSSWQMN